MKIGTRTVLYGVHQFLLHPWFVAEGWRRPYGLPVDPRLWIAFFLHDVGYIGKANLDGVEGEQHPEFGAKIMRAMFGKKWGDFCRYHSRFLAKKDGKRVSRLCLADKLAIALCPAWLYLPMARATGELNEYMKGQGARTPSLGRTPGEWYADVQAYCESWAYEHADCKDDTWTGTKRDLAIHTEAAPLQCECQPWEGTCGYCRAILEKRSS